MSKRFVIKIISAAVCITLVLACFCGCSSDNKNKILHYKAFAASETPNGQTVENGGFALSWDSEKKCVLLYDKTSGKTWSSIPYGYYNNESPEGVAMVRMYSPIILKYCESNTLQTKTVYAYADCLSNNTVTCKTEKNGFTVTYYFDHQQISIPVCYLLTDGGLEVKLMVKDIRESTNIVCEVSLSPFFCSVKNGDGYLVIPSGSGAIMYTDEGKRQPRTFYGEVYGDDLNSANTAKVSLGKEIRMAFFGAVSNEGSLCGVISKGADSAIIEAVAGDSEIGYSSVWTTFVLRGYSILQRSTLQNGTDVASYYTASHVAANEFSVNYYPLSENGYYSVAKKYAECLKLDKKKSNTEDNSLYLRILGGAKVRKSVFGIPYKKLYAATSFDEAADILKSISKETGADPVTQLLGFCTDGLDCERHLSGRSFAYELGGKKGYDALKTYCDENEIPLYTDYDFIRYSKSGVGVTSKNGVVSAKGIRLKASYYGLSSRNSEKDGSHYLLGFDSYKDSTLSLADYLVKNNINAVSLSSLTDSSYSDYSDRKYYAKNSFSLNASNVLRLLKSKNIKVASQGGNDYVAGLTSCIFEAPMTCDSSFAADEEIPLYAIVFKGYIPLSVPSVNLADDSRRMILKAVETGSGLCFTVCGDWDSGLLDLRNNAFAFSSWDSVSKQLKGAYEDNKDVINSVCGCTIAGHERLTKDVYKITFSNGKIVVVNYSDDDILYGGATVKSLDYYFGEE